jgi:hypothetical protein
VQTTGAFHVHAFPCLASTLLSADTRNGSIFTLTDVGRSRRARADARVVCPLVRALPRRRPACRRRSALAVLNFVVSPAVRVFPKEDDDTSSERNTAISGLETGRPTASPGGSRDADARPPLYHGFSDGVESSWK